MNVSACVRRQQAFALATASAWGEPVLPHPVGAPRGKVRGVRAVTDDNPVAAAQVRPPPDHQGLTLVDSLFGST
jgi:hypothetical protein